MFFPCTSFNQTLMMMMMMIDTTWARRIAEVQMSDIAAVPGCDQGYTRGWPSSLGDTRHPSVP